MAKLEPIQLDVITESDGRGLSEAEKGVLNFSASAIDASKKIVAAYAVVGTAVVGAVGFGIKMAGDLEAARAGFVALLGSADEADATMTRIKKEAAATPFELPGLVAGTQALAAVTKDGDKAIDMLLNVGKAVATSGKGQFELDRVVQNLQQISSTGQMTEADLKQFRSAIPIFDDIVGSLGMTVDELKNSGNAAELLQLAFAEAGKEGGVTSQGFISQAGTWNQLFSNFKDNMGIIASEFVTQTGIFDAAKQALGGIVDAMASIATPEAFQQFMTFLKENQQVVAIFAGIIAGPLVAALAILAINAWLALAPVLLFAAPFAAAGAAIALLMPYFPALWAVVQPVIEGIGASIMTFINTHMPAFQAFWDVVKGIFTFALGFIESFIKTTWQGIAQFFKGIWEIIVGVFKIALGVIEVVFGVFQGIFTGNWDKAWTTMKVGFTDIWEGIKSVFKGILDAMIGYFKTFVNGFIGIINGMIGGINKVMSAAGGEGSIQIPEIPHLARGTRNFQGGVALVGEEGPELVSLPRGSSVTPNNQLRQVAQSSDQRPISIIQNIQDSIDLDFALREIAYEMRTA